MESLLLSAENVLFHLRQNQSKIKYLHIIKILESVEKHECENNSQKQKILEELLQLLLNETLKTNVAADGAIIFGCVIWLTYLQEQQKLPCLNESQFVNMWQWLLEHHERNENNIDVVSRIIIALGNVFSLHLENCEKYFILTLQVIVKYISSNTATILLINSLQCLDKVFGSLKDVKFSSEQDAACLDVGQKLLQLHYDNEKLVIDSPYIAVVILYTLQILNKIVTLNSNFAKLQASELLGISKAYFHFGVDVNVVSFLKPQKVNISQQALYDSAEEIEVVINSENVRSCGGKALKTRKPRGFVKNIRSSDKVLNNSPDKTNVVLAYDIKTSESEASEPENVSNRILFERSRTAKIRLAAIYLVGSITRILERKTLFGYWHALFPNGSVDSIDNLLYIGQNDPNLRCRSVALQVCAHLLYGSVGFLHQAEFNIKRCPKTFIPFSVSLGYTILSIYKSLSTILSKESSLPVLTQALKCLAVLVQASPFQKFEKGFVQNFVKDVKPLVYHRDAAIQVSALMVMEFLAAFPEPTSDIAESMGLLPETVTDKKINLQPKVDGEIDVVDNDELLEFEDDFSEHCENTKDVSFIQNAPSMSWLLKLVLHNLSIQDKVVSTSVRIESLQVLIAMSSHFAIIRPHLKKVSEVLQRSLNDTLPDVRLYASRCVDTCAYQINRYLENNSSSLEIKKLECNTFWQNMMPIIMSHIRRDSEEITTVRINLCDALSNIGMLMFEHMPHSNQISMLSFLSGVSSDGSEEIIVRVAGARALAVFALFPSLRCDFVFIENTAELILRLVNDANLLVRVKSFWSLGNISDVLIWKETEVPLPRQEHISDDLLFRLIIAATTACSDNNKVRCNSVRTLGNLLRLLTDEHFNNCKSSNINWRQTFEKSICKLTDCIRSSGNAKVKWNTCYAVSNVMRNPAIFKLNDLYWRETLFSALCHVIVHHSNFKVRINASVAITNITERTYFGIYYEKFWSSVLLAIEQSYNLDNFNEYNHRDSLQEQLCLALSHIIMLANKDDLPMLKKHILPYVETVRNTWKRVSNRMVPEKAAPILSCPIVLLERLKPQETLTSEQKNTIDFLIEILNTE